MKSPNPPYSEEFFNFHTLCDAVFQKDMAQARLILEDQSQCLFQREEPSWEAMMVFLTSMNRSLYNYILYRTSLSLYQCCAENGKIIHKCRNKEEFFALAERILATYCNKLDAGCTHCSCRYIARAKAYIDWNLDKRLSLEEVAAQVYISKAYLSELFTSHTGTSFSAYVTERRMQRAKQLLMNTKMSIQDIGQACGFYSSAYFSTVFTKRFGLSPRRYRVIHDTTLPA